MMVNNLKIKFLLYAFLLLSQLSFTQNLRERIDYYDNGKVKSKGYFLYSGPGEDAKELYPTGQWTFYYENGMKLIQGKYENGMMSGLWELYYENGKKRLDAIYKLRKVQNAGEGYIRKSGSPPEKVMLNDEYDSFCHGVWTSYWDDGTPATSYTFHSGSEVSYGSNPMFNDLISVNVLKTRFNQAYKYKNGSYGKGEMVLIDITPKLAYYLEDGKYNIANAIKAEIPEIFITGNFRRSGLWEEFDSNGVKVIDVPYNWKTNLAEGIATVYYPSGKKKSETTYVEGKNSGPAVYFYENSGKMRSKGELYEGQLIGTWISFYEDGSKKSEEFYSNDKRGGNSVTYHPNGKIESKGMYINNMKRGKWLWYFTSGNLMKEENYEMGKVSGEVTYYYPSGNLLGKEFFSNGELSRPIICYDEEGKEILANGSGLMLRYHSSGKLASRIAYRNGSRDGLSVWYYDNGLEEESLNYRYDENSKPYGLRWEIVSSYHKNGKPREKGTLKEGNGSWIRYNDKGETTDVWHFRNGVRQKS